MTRATLKDLGLEDDVIKKIMDINGEDIEKAKATTKELEQKIAEKDSTIDELNEKIKTFDGSEDTIKDLQSKVAEYEKKESERKEAEEKEKAEEELKERFSRVVGDKKFRDEDAEHGRFEAFREALSSNENKGKGDAEIFEALVKDRDVFENPQRQKIVLGSNGGSGGTDDEPTKFKNFF